MNMSAVWSLVRTDQCCRLYLGHLGPHAHAPNETKYNGYVLEPLVEHWVDSQVLSTLTVQENGLGLHRVICSLPNPPEATPVSACQHTLPDTHLHRRCGHSCLELGLPRYMSSRRKDYVSLDGSAREYISSPVRIREDMHSH